MRRREVFVLIIMIVGIGMIIRTFFGGNPVREDGKPLQDESSGFVEELSNNGGVISTGDDVRVFKNLQKGFSGIKIMMPEYFYNSGWDAFVNDIYDKNQIQVHFILVDDLNSYRDLLYDKNFSGADLFLFPYDRKERISTKTFVLSHDLSLYFDKLLSSFFSDNEFTFIPFSADPMIMYTVSGHSFQTNFYSISEYVSNRESSRPLSFPLFFGIEAEDYDNKGFKWEYQDIVRYALMHYFMTNHDSHDLQIRIDSNLQNSQKYNIQDINTIINAITNPKCKIFPSICLQIYNFVGIRFGFLSDVDIVNKYFTGKIENFEKLSKFKLPFFQQESPIRIWGRGVSDSLEDSQIQNGVNEFLEKYIYEHDQYNLRNSTLPVFKTEGGNGILDNEYIGLAGYVLQEGGDYINTLRGMEDFWDLIEYRTTAQDYIN